MRQLNFIPGSKGYIDRDGSWGITHRCSWHVSFAFDSAVLERNINDHKGHKGRASAGKVSKVTPKISKPGIQAQGQTPNKVRQRAGSPTGGRESSILLRELSGHGRLPL